MENNEKMFDYGMVEWAVLMLELEGYDTLLKSREKAVFVGGEWFNYIGKYCDIYDTHLRIINDSEIYSEISFIHDEKFYTVNRIIRYTENGLRGYDNDGEPIYGFVDLDE